MRDWQTTDSASSGKAVRKGLGCLMGLTAVVALYLVSDPKPVGYIPEASQRRVPETGPIVKARTVSVQQPVPPPETLPTPPIPQTPPDGRREAQAKASDQAGASPGQRARSDSGDDRCEENSAELRGRLALLMNLLLLERGHRRLRELPGYTATFSKIERIEGELSDKQVMNLKLRHDPFSIYLEWLEGHEGRELLYVEGQNDGDLIVRAGGLKGRLLPALKLDPHGSMAMSESRHPVTKLGMLNLAEELIRYRRSQLQRNPGPHCWMEADCRLNDRDCYRFTLKFRNRETSQLYRKSIVWIDKERYFPVSVKNYTWPANPQAIPKDQLDEQTLVEHYTYRDIRLNTQLADRDFDRSNKNYSFR